MYTCHSVLLVENFLLLENAQKHLYTYRMWPIKIMQNTIKSHNYYNVVL